MYWNKNGIPSEGGNTPPFKSEPEKILRIERKEFNAKGIKMITVKDTRIVLYIAFADDTSFLSESIEDTSWKCINLDFFLFIYILLTQSNLYGVTFLTFHNRKLVLLNNLL